MSQKAPPKHSVWGPWGRGRNSSRSDPAPGAGKVRTICSFHVSPWVVQEVIRSLLGPVPVRLGQGAWLAELVSGARVGYTGPRSVCWRLGPWPVPGDSPALSQIPLSWSPYSQMLGPCRRPRWAAQHSGVARGEMGLLFFQPQDRELLTACFLVVTCFRRSPPWPAGCEGGTALLPTSLRVGLGLC